MPLAKGQVLQGRYQIEALLGHGGMGAVYRAIDLTFGAEVAVKENLETSPKAKEQFIREARILHRLRHPSLPRVTDHFFVENQGQYLVMDFVEGRTLAEIMIDGPVREGQSLSWTGRILDALEYLHVQGIIHRDVKPANVKIAPDGRVFLVDFGLAKIYSQQKTTTIGARGVTPGFAPPEQYGQGRTDVRSDLYSVGATLYAILTGKLPADALELVTGQADLVPPNRYNPELSPRIVAVIMRAMQIRPADRFQSVAELRAALFEHQPGRRSTRAKSGKETSPRRPRVAWLLSLGALLTVLFLALVIWRFSGPGDDGPSEPAPGDTYTRARDNMVMVYVPSGQFLMGAEESDGQSADDEKPQHLVHLDAFWIDKYEVTNRQYRTCVDMGICSAPVTCSLGTPTFQDASKADHPVVCVSWADAKAYCAWVGARLPTEAEWEKAARAADGREYPWGDAPNGDNLNLCDQSCMLDHRVSGINDGYAQTAPVGSYPAGNSPYGAMDMAGNVWEWVADWYSEDYYSRAPDSNPIGPSTGERKASRGGSWDSDWYGVRSTCRNWDAPDFRGETVGFRCALSADSLVP